VAVSAALSTGELLSVPGLRPAERRRLKRDVRAMMRSARGTVGQPGRNVRQKAGLNRAILANRWGALLDRLEDKAPGRVQKIYAAYTSQRWSACGHVAPGNRESQAFRCVACGHQAHADVNVALTIATEHAMTAWGGEPLGAPTNREPTTLGAVA
jgi:putative transposase